MIESIQRKNSTAKFLLQAATASLDNLNQNVSYQWGPKYPTVACSNQNAHVPTTNSDMHFKTHKKLHSEKATCMRKCVIKYQRMGTLFLFSSSEMRYR